MGTHINQTDAKVYDVGCIVGRFQTPDLHEAHRQLIDTVLSKHKKVVIFLGVNRSAPSEKNPLDFPSRRKMINQSYPDVEVCPLPDCKSDVVWAKNLDSRIREIYPKGSICLYGSRDSFIEYYKPYGSFDTVELKQTIFVSATEKRKEAAEEVIGSPLWRAGVCYAHANRYPISYQTVDIACVSFINGVWNTLLARKPDEDELRFIGGFVDPTDLTLEDAARREFSEEAGITYKDQYELQGQASFTYIGSYRVDDWRYRSEKDKIMTAFFIIETSRNDFQPSDDIVELRWVPISDLANTKIVRGHQPLLTDFISKFNKIYNS
jgi:bifunctional NMN adenylyltransferase/nudix hydrolase